MLFRSNRSLAYFTIAFELAFGRMPHKHEEAAYKLDLLEREHAFFIDRGKDTSGFLYDPKPPAQLIKQRALVKKLEGKHFEKHPPMWVDA